MGTGYVNICLITSTLIVKKLLQILFYKYYIFACGRIFKELMCKVDYLTEITIL